jgi:hypothetical protein
MDRKAWQGESVDEVWLDEDPGDDVIYGEYLARLTATRGRVSSRRWPTVSSRARPFAATYRKLGLNMLLKHATFKDGGYNFENGIAEMELRFATGRLRIAQHLHEVLDECRGYHRVNGLVHKVDDDLLSAIRVLSMQIRSAKVLLPNRPHRSGSFVRGGQPQFALLMCRCACDTGD